MSISDALSENYPGGAFICRTKEQHRKMVHANNTIFTTKQYLILFFLLKKPGKNIVCFIGFVFRDTELKDFVRKKT